MAAGDTTGEVGFITRRRHKIWDDEDQLLWSFQQRTKGARDIRITICLQMTFYRLNDYFFSGEKLHC